MCKPRCPRCIRVSFELQQEVVDSVVQLPLARRLRRDRSRRPGTGHRLRAAGAIVARGFFNDFEAQAFACRSKAAEEAEHILPGSPVADAPVAVIGAGTGLGKALLVQDEKNGCRAIPSEGGHANFPFLTGRETPYQEFLMQERHEQYITGNTVVSGKGLSYLHRFLTGRVKEPEDVVKEFSSYPDTLAWAANFYARVCRNYVLETLCLGGLYVAGGLAARAPELLRHPEFEKEFRSSDTMARLLAQVPVYLIRDENSGLWGGAVLARQKLREATDA